MSRRRLLWFAALAPLVVAILPRSIAHADTRIFLPFAFAPTCNFASPAHGPTPGPLPTLAARRWEHLRPADEVRAMALDPRTGDVWSVGIDGVAKRSRDAVSKTSYTEADGLPGDFGTDVAVAPDGKVWAIVDGELARLRADGRWTWTEEPVGATDVAVDRSGGVWVAGWSGVARLGAECGWEYPVRGWPIESKVAVTDLLAAANGDVWAAFSRQDGSRGVVVRRADGRWASFGTADGLRVDRGPVLTLAERPDGQIWALLDTTEYSAEVERMVALVDVLGVNGRWSPASMNEVELDARNFRLTSIAFDGAGRTWFAGESRIFVPDDARPGRWRVEDPGRPVVQVTGLIVDADGVAWVGSGTIHRRLPDGTWRDEWIGGPAFPHRVAVAGADVWMDTMHRHADEPWEWVGADAPAMQVVLNDMALAPDGVWYATDDGLVRRAADGTWTQFSVPRALGGHNILALTTTPDGSVWAVARTSSTGPLVTRHRPDEQWDPHTIATRLPNEQVRGVASGGDGTVWVGTDGVGADGEAARRVVSFRPDGTTAEVDLPGDLRTGGIQAMAGDASSALWLFSAEHGLVRRAADGTWDAFAGQPVVDLSLRDPTDRPHVPTLAIGPDGSAWIGGRSGEVRVRLPDGAWRSLMLVDMSRVRDIAIGPDGRAWMTMADGGSPRVVEVAR